LRNSSSTFQRKKYDLRGGLFMKRILSGIFAALLILCALPVAAFAEQQPSDIDPITVQPISASGGEIVRPTWLAYGPITQYPAEGGTWEYGFWDAKVRSYYTVNRCHGSTVVLNGNTVRSADTAAGKKSIAEKWALQWPSHDDRYYYRVCD
jgi:hypothetical protein